MDQSFVTVIRNGISHNILNSDIHLGDIVLLQTGDIVPADLKLVESRSLEVDEFDVTGELMPVLKTIASEEVFVYMGCRIIRGSGKGIVTAIGNETVYGKVLDQVAAANQIQNHYQFRLSQLWILLLLLPVFLISLFQSTDRIITIVIFTIAGTFFLYFQGNELINLFLLKLEQQKIEKRKICIRNREVIPFLNEIDTICFDKTGVLTTRQMEILKFFVYSSLTEIDANSLNVKDGIQHLIRTASVLCTDVSYFEKIRFANPIDQALISFAQKNRVDLEEISSKFQRITEMPFDSQKRFMFNGYETKEKVRWFFLKGDPDVVLLHCKDYFDEDGEKKRLDFNLFSKIKGLSKSISENGDTPIAMAVAVGYIDPQLKEFVFLCLVQFENTLQEEAREVVEKISRMGLRSILLTGDSPEAAIKIAHACGIAHKSNLSLSGNVIDRMNLQEVGKQAEYCSVFSRLLPEQKAMVIRQLQKRKHRILMVGDGPNDGIALNVSDIGISFQKDSSPIARKYSSILINRLNDLPDLFREAHNFNVKLKKLRYCKITFIFLLILTIYLIVFLKIRSIYWS